MPKTIGILMFDEVEELDFVGPWETFGMAQRMGAEHELLLIAPTHEPIKARYGLRVMPDTSMADAPELDVLLVPGGYGARVFARHDAAILQFIRETHERGAWVVSVCTGALILANAGVLTGHHATTHHSAFDLLRETPNIDVVEDQRWIIEPPIATSAGVSAGVDLALALLETWYGAELKSAVAAQIEWGRMLVNGKQ